MQFDSNMESDFEASSFLRGSSRNPPSRGFPTCLLAVSCDSLCCNSRHKQLCLSVWPTIRCNFRLASAQRRTNEWKVAWVLRTRAPRWRACIKRCPNYVIQLSFRTISSKVINATHHQTSRCWTTVSKISCTRISTYWLEEANYSDIEQEMEAN